MRLEPCYGFAVFLIFKIKFMNNLFNSEKEAIQWVKEITPFAIIPKRKAKTTYVNPFTSVNAFEVITDIIGEELFKRQEKSKIATNKDL